MRHSTAALISIKLCVVATPAGRLIYLSLCHVRITKAPIFLTQSAVAACLVPVAVFEVRAKYAQRGGSCPRT